MPSQKGSTSKNNFVKIENKDRGGSIKELYATLFMDGPLDPRLNPF